MRLKILSFGFIIPILMNYNTYSVDVGDSLDTLCDDCAGGGTNGGCNCDCPFIPSCIPAPIGVDIAEIRGSVRELQRLFCKLNKKLEICQQQSSLAAGLASKVSQNRTSLTNLLLEVGTLQDEVTTLRTQTNSSLNDLEAEISTVITEVDTALDAKEEAISDLVDDRLAQALIDQSAILDNRLNSVNQWLEALRSVLGISDDISLIGNNNVVDILQDVDILKSRTNVIEDNIGNIKSTELRNLMLSLDSSFGTSNVKNMVTSIVNEIIAIKQNFESNTINVIDNHLETLNNLVNQHSSQISALETGLNNLTNVLGTLTIDDVNNLKNLATFVEDAISTKMNSSEFYADMVNKCRTIINLFTGDIVNAAIAPLQADITALQNESFDISGMQSDIDTLTGIVENQGLSLSTQASQISTISGQISDIYSILSNIESYLESLSIELELDLYSPTSTRP